MTLDVRLIEANVSFTLSAIYLPPVIIDMNVGINFFSRLYSTTPNIQITVALPKYNVMIAKFEVGGNFTIANFVSNASGSP